MTVTADDKTLYTWPVSTGRPKNPTIQGNLVVWYKQQDVLMDSQSIGIPRNSPDGYYEHVYWDTAISTDGFFIHSAPWSEWAQGSQNVSHGCVNLSPSRAETFFNFTQKGDLVIVTNTGHTGDASDGEGDWQIAFDQYANSGGTVSSAAPQQPGGL
jgi:lipoprotein-anchoring transpeptidase ErfK/SrfK